MIHRFKPYPAYKDSGVPWLGKIPEHWEVIPLKRVTASRCDGPFGSALKSSHYTDSGTRVIRLQNIGHGAFRASDAAFISSDYARSLGDHSVVADDLLIAGLGDDRHPAGRACVAPPGIEPAIVKADCFLFRLRTGKALPQFTALQLTATAEAASAALSTGATRQRINLVSTSDRAIALPPLAEQLTITRFLENLNRSTQLYIRAKKKLIALLNEQKQAIIHRAVTRGLDPDAQLKPSGVEWLGEVPAHWEVRTLGQIANSLRTGPFGSILHQTDYIDGGIPVVNPVHMRHGDIVEDIRCSVSAAMADRLSTYRLERHDIVFSRRGELGRCALVRDREVGWLCGTGSIRVRATFHGIEPEYLIQALQGKWVGSYLAAFSVGTTMQNLNTGILKGVPLPLPPAEEQRQILSHVARTTGDLDRLISVAKEENNLVKEFFTRLISDVVTGKLDLREAAAQLSEEMDGLEPLDEGEELTEGEEGSEGNESTEGDDSPEEAAI
jgi:type I restriction enzyme S subunit